MHLVIINKATCKRDLYFGDILLVQRNSNKLGCKGMIHTKSNLKHTQNMYDLFISKHQVPQSYEYNEKYHLWLLTIH